MSGAIATSRPSQDDYMDRVQEEDMAAMSFCNLGGKPVERTATAPGRPGPRRAGAAAVQQPRPAAAERRAN